MHAPNSMHMRGSAPLRDSPAGIWVKLSSIQVVWWAKLCRGYVCIPVSTKQTLFHSDTLRQPLQQRAQSKSKKRVEGAPCLPQSNRVPGIDRYEAAAVPPHRHSIRRVSSWPQHAIQNTARNCPVGEKHAAGAGAASASCHTNLQQADTHTHAGLWLRSQRVAHWGPYTLTSLTKLWLQQQHCQAGECLIAAASQAAEQVHCQAGHLSREPDGNIRKAFHGSHTGHTSVLMVEALGTMSAP